MKKVLCMLLCLCMMISILPTMVFAAVEYEDKIYISMAHPVIGEKPTDPWVMASFCERTALWWEGEFDANGCFIEGNRYTMYLQLTVNDSYVGRKEFDCEKFVAELSASRANKELPTRMEDFSIASISNTQVMLYHTFDVKNWEAGEEITTITATVPEPIINQVPANLPSDVKFQEDIPVEVKSFEWLTLMGVNYFLENQTYVCNIIVRIKDGYDRYFTSAKNKNLTINGLPARMHSISYDLKEATIAISERVKPIPASQASAESNASASSVAQPVVSAYFTMDTPYAWEYADKTITVEQSDQMEVTNVKWNGMMWNADGTFVQGASYTVDITVRLKSGVNMYFDPKGFDLKINGVAGPEIVEVSEDKKQAVIRGYYSRLKSKAEIALDQKEKEEAEANKNKNRKGKPADKLEPGDYGTARHIGSIYLYEEPKTGSKSESKASFAHLLPETGDIVEIVEAYVASANRENEFYHVVKNADGEIRYTPVSDRLIDFYVEGNNAKRPYSTKWASLTKYGDPIEKVTTYLLEFPDGKPKYNFYGEKDELFYIEKIEYEHPDGVKPFMHTSAVVTYKAKDGYYFDKNLKLNEYRIQAEHTTGFKIIDDKTMEVYLTAFTWDMGYDVSITDEMRAFEEKVKNMHLIPMASAELYFPLFDHWDLKLQSRDFEFNEIWVTRFQEKNMRMIYDLPTSKAHATKYPRNYTLGTLQIADDDLSDDIPGLVGDWCLLTDGRYIPRSCLKNFEYETMFKGAPAEFIDTPFEFAGGSGTMEDPFLIENANQLNAVRKGPKYHYKLIADIDLSGWGNWVPIGGTPAYGFLGNGKASDYAYSFQGSFDGNGHVISGMQIIINEETPFMTAMTGNYRAYGLFASMATNPVEYKIKNLGVVDFTIDVTYTNVEKQLDLYAAAIVGGMNNGTDIYNCYSKGGKINFNITAKSGYSPAANFRVGGICSDGGGVFGGQGNPRPGASWMHIEKCFNDSDINITLNGMEGYAYAGGIIASIDTTHIHECYNSGNITLPVNEGDYEGSWHESVAAGIAAFASIPEIPNVYHKPPEGASFIQNCYNSGNITARGAAGIFMQSSSDIHFENCYNVGTITGNKLDESTGYPTSSATVSPMAVVTQFGTEFIRNCYSNGTSVSGAAWKNSSALGRKVLAAHPEDNPPSTAYNFKPTPVGKFTDVHVGDWYATPVSWAVRAKITSGTSETTFSPDMTCTRAQILTFMWRADGAPKMNGENPFTDVTKSDYFYDAALWAYENDMVSGGTFAGNTPCTRADTVVYLWKRDGSPKANKYQGNFADVAASDAFATAVAWALRYGITSGTSDTTFSPDMTCTRGQIVTFLRRAY